MPTTTGGFVEDGHRRVAELDEAIIDLVRRRTEVCAELVAMRRAAGGPVIELARENEVLRRYCDALGGDGTSLALLLIERGRRAAVCADGLVLLEQRCAGFSRRGDLPVSDVGTSGKDGEDRSTAVTT
jgi:chorismate mutase